MSLYGQLPESLTEVTLDQLEVGQVAWTVPWAMWVDDDRRCWLHPKHTAHGQPGGTVQMRLERLHDGSFLVDVRCCASHRWQPTTNPRYVGSDAGTRWLPVASLVTP